MIYFNFFVTKDSNDQNHMQNPNCRWKA